MTELWEGANDEEREELMQAMVVWVEMDQKEEGTCEVALMPQVPSDWLGLTSRMGAVLHEVTNYPDLYIRDFAVPRPPRKGAKFRRETA